MSDDRERADQLAATVPDGATEIDATVADDATAPASAADDALPTRVGRYEIVTEVGAGAMGTVYRARDPELDRVLAIKVIRARRGDTRARLLREAQAMAKVRHPNVVPIFDVGTLDEDGDGDREGGIFVVMPLVAGGTLRAWMRKGPHPWRQVVSRFAAAGRGLAAAHAAGLVHRDFKPDNVLVAEDGEILVADFGLALAHDTSADAAADSARSIETSTIAGTPAYMAPEQRAGGALDARTDQFAFCIAFWEGLFGERPGDARTRTLARSPLAKRSALRADGDAPAWLKAALERGLSADPAKRWPTVSALLDHVRARQLRPRRVAIGAAIAVPAIAAVTFAVVTRAPEVDPCAGAGEPVAKVWTPARRAAIRNAITAIDAPYAADVAAYVDAQFEKAARSFTAARVEACIATNVRGEQSPQLLDARIGCLDRHLDKLDALAARLEHPDRAMLDRANAAVSGLDRVNDCAQVVELNAMPSEPADPAIKARILAARRGLAVLAADADLAAPTQALATKATEFVTAARETGYCPLVADALLARGSILTSAAENRDDVLDAHAVLRQAASMADSCAYDRTRAVALLAFAETLDQVKSNPAEEVALFEETAAAVTRANDPKLRVALAVMRADQARSDQQLPRAETLAEEALALVRASDDPHAPSALAHVAQILSDRGKLDRAEALASESYQEMRRRFGANHPQPTMVAQLLAGIRKDRGDNAGAIALFEEVLRVQRGAYGPNHRRVLITLVNLGQARALAGLQEQARRDLEEAMPAVKRVFGAEHRLVAAALDGLVVACARDPEQAIAYGREALAISAKVDGPDSLSMAGRRQNLAEALARTGRHDEAVTEFRQALATFEKQLAPNARELTNVRFDLGRSLAAVKKPREAIPLLDQARAGFAKANDRASLADTDLALADAHLALGDRKAADADIAAVLAAFPDAKDPKHAAALAWQAAHPR